MKNREEFIRQGGNKKRNLAKKIVASFAMISVLVIVALAAIKFKLSDGSGSF